MMNARIEALQRRKSIPQRMNSVAYRSARRAADKQQGKEMKVAISIALLIVGVVITMVAIYGYVNPPFYTGG